MDDHSMDTSANLAIAVHPEVEYVAVKHGEEVCSGEGIGCYVY